MKIKEEEKVRRRPVSHPCPGPQGTWQSVLVDTIPTGWREASPGPSTLESRQEAGGRFQPQEAEGRVKLCHRQRGRAGTGDRARQPLPVRLVGTWVLWGRGWAKDHGRKGCPPGAEAVVVTGAFLHWYADFHGLLGTFWYACFFTREETFKRKEPIIIVQKKETRELLAEEMDRSGQI